MGHGCRILIIKSKYHNPLHLPSMYPVVELYVYLCGVIDVCSLLLGTEARMKYTEGINLHTCTITMLTGQLDHDMSRTRVPSPEEVARALFATRNTVNMSFVTYCFPLEGKAALMCNVT